MEKEITAQIGQLFKDTDEIPLFYIESGSRLWGMASPDSDFDVRGFHLQSKKQYYDFKQHRDIIEVMDGDFDFVSFDIDKMFGLLAKSNSRAFEWIRAHIVYLNILPEWTAFREQVIENIDFRSLFYSYISLANKHSHLMETGKKFTYKAAFYSFRGLLSADLATRHIVPELLIDDLFKQFDEENEVLKIANDNLARKQQQTEKEEVSETDKEKMLTAIKNFTAQLELKVPERSNDRQKLENVLTDYSHFIKEKYYG